MSNNSTSIPAWTLGTALLISAPSTGFLYVHNLEEFTAGIGQRSIATAITLLGAGLIALDNSIDDPEGTPKDITGAAMFLGGIGFFVISTVSDILYVREATDSYNRKQRWHAQVSPAIDPVNKSASLRLSIDF